MNPIYDQTMAMPGVDIHSHLRGEHTQAYDLAEVFFYHVAAQAMIAAGMPPELWRDERPAEDRIRDALPYFAKIRNTTMFWVIKQALRRMHDFDAEDLSWGNWESLCQTFRETSDRAGWAREVLCERAKLSLSITGMVDGRNGIAPDQQDFMDYSCEQPITSGELIGLLEHKGGNRITTTESLLTAVEAHIEDRVEAGADSFTYWPARGFTCPPEEAPNVDAILTARARGEKPTNEQLRALDGAVSHRSLAMLNDRSLPLVMCVGITHGAKRRTLLRYDAREPNEILGIALRYPNVPLVIMLGNVEQSHELNTIAKQLPNVYLACSWWHGMYPAYAERELAERLEMIPYTRLIAIITDAYSAEWSVARSILGRHVLARALWRKVEDGEYTEAFALEIARAMLHDNPAELFAR